jgi:Bacterial Ig domain
MCYFILFSFGETIMSLRKLKWHSRLALAAGGLAILGGCPETDPQAQDSTGGDSQSTAKQTPPVADAGADIFLTDLDGSGTELAFLSAHNTKRGSGKDLRYAWTVGGQTLGVGLTVQLPLGPGVHEVVLLVTDEAGLSSSDRVTVSIVDRFGQAPLPTRLRAPLDLNAHVTGNSLPFGLYQSKIVPPERPSDVRISGDDFDDAPETLAFRVTALPTNGTLTGSPPNLVYTPNPGFLGFDEFAFQPNDGKADGNPASVFLRVSIAADLPTPVTPPQFQAPEGHATDIYAVSACEGMLYSFDIDQLQSVPVGGLGKNVVELGVRPGGEVRAVSLRIDEGRVELSVPEVVDPILLDWPEDADIPTAYVVDENGTHWIAGNDIMARLDPDSGAITVVRDLVGRVAGDIEVGRDGKLLIVTASGELLEFDRSNGDVRVRATLVSPPDCGFSGLARIPGDRLIALTCDAKAYEIFESLGQARLLGQITGEFPIFMISGACSVRQ